MDKQTCSTCRWWEAPKGPVLNAPGVCRRRAPECGDDGWERRWPPTDDNDWCGDHEPNDRSADKRGTMSTTEPKESIRDRQDTAVARLCSIADSLRYCPPEGVSAYLFNAQTMLNHHFAESIARADAPYVTAILRQVEARKRQDAEFAAELQALQDRSTNKEGPP